MSMCAVCVHAHVCVWCLCSEANVSISQNPVTLHLGVEMCDIFPAHTGTSAGIGLMRVLFEKPYC